MSLKPLQLEKEDEDLAQRGEINCPFLCLLDDSYEADSNGFLKMVYLLPASCQAMMGDTEFQLAALFFLGKFTSLPE